MPVLPEVASISVSPGLISPRSSARRIMLMRRPVLHRAGRVVAFELAQDDVAARVVVGAGQALQAHQRRAADRVFEGLVGGELAIHARIVAVAADCRSARLAVRPACHNPRRVPRAPTPVCPGGEIGRRSGTQNPAPQGVPVRVRPRAPPEGSRTRGTRRAARPSPHCRTPPMPPMPPVTQALMLICIGGVLPGHLPAAGNLVRAVAAAAAASSGPGRW